MSGDHPGGHIRQAAGWREICLPTFSVLTAAKKFGCAQIRLIGIRGVGWIANSITEYGYTDYLPSRKKRSIYV